MSQDTTITTILPGQESVPCNIGFIYRGIRLMFLVAVLVSPQLGQAESVPLVFDTFTPGTNVKNMCNALGPGYTGGVTMCFTDVATYQGTTIDARVTAVVQPNTGFATGTTNKTGRGYIPNYKATTTGQPKGDLALVYDGADRTTAGITLTLSFFDGTGSLSGKFSKAYVLPDLTLLIYDVDGEPGQTEWFDAFSADGLYSYTTGSAPASVTATPTARGVHFVGPGKDFRETDTSGAALLRYRNASSITLAFGAEQNREGRNPAFAAIDGNLSLPVAGGFHDPTVVPAPKAVPPAPPVEPPTPPRRSGPWSASRLYPADNVIRLDRLTPAEVPLQVPFDYTLRVTNVTETPVYEVVVTERLPRSFTLQSCDPAAEKEDANLRWRIDSLDPKASREIKISGIATTADTLKPCATVTFVVPLCSSIAVAEQKLTFAMTAFKEVLVCDPIEVQFVVTNAGTSTAQGVKIVAALPAGLRTADGKTELVLNVGALAPGQARQFTGSLKATKTGEYVNKAVASAESGWKAEASTTTIVRQPVLAITKTGPDRQYIGRPTTYEITVTNKGDAPAAKTIVEDAIPQGAQGVQTSPAGAVSGSKVVWQLGTLAVNASKKVSITYTPAGAGSLAQTATASAVCADPVTATSRTAVFGIAAVLLEVIDTDDPVQIGGRTTYVITATNQGSSPSTKVQIIAAVEDTEEIVAANGPSSVTIAGNTARFAPLATLAPKAKATWQVTVKALKAGDVRFRAALTTAELERPVEETEATQLYK